MNYPNLHIGIEKEIERNKALLSKLHRDHPERKKIEQHVMEAEAAFKVDDVSKMSRFFKDLILNKEEELSKWTPPTPPIEGKRK